MLFLYGKPKLIVSAGPARDLRLDDACLAAQTTVVLAGATVQGIATSEPLGKAMVAAPEEDYAVNSMLAPPSVTATGSNMDWTNLYTEPVQPVSIQRPPA